jgi:hypothetical protein
VRYQKTSLQVFVSGGKGQGKTTLTDRLASTSRRVFCFDPNDEYAAKGYARFTSLGELIAYLKTHWRKSFRVAFVPTFENMPDQLNRFCKLICAMQSAYYHTPDGSTPPIAKVMLIVDEMRWSMPQHSSVEWLEMISTRGRHYGVDVIGTTVRFAEVSTKFRGNCDLHFFSAQHDHTDLTTAAKMVGKAHVQHLKQLQPHEYLRVFRGRVERGRNSLN